MKRKIKLTVGRDIDLDQEIILDKDGTRITELRAQEIAQEVLLQIGKTPEKKTLDR